MAINNATWNSLPANIREAIDSVSGEHQATRFGVVLDTSRQQMPENIAIAGSNIYEFTLPQETIDIWKSAAGEAIWDQWVIDMVSQGHTNAQTILDETIRLSGLYAGGNP